MATEIFRKEGYNAFERRRKAENRPVPELPLIFALEGEAVIGYDGTEYAVRAGENFKFVKDGAHYVKAEKPFKMALPPTPD